MILIIVKNRTGKIQERISFNGDSQFRTYRNPEGEFEKPKGYNSTHRAKSEKNFKGPRQTRWP